jgi:hypothetical protein
MNEKKENDFGMGVAEKHPNGQPEEHYPDEQNVVTPTSEIQEETDSVTLVSSREIEDFRSRWHAIQMSFVDEPHTAVDEANNLTGEVFERITDQFTKEQNRLKEQWLDSDDHSTEDLRIGLQRYRAFFDQLLDVL